MKTKSTIALLVVAYLGNTAAVNETVSAFVSDVVEHICGDTTKYNESIQQLRDVARHGSQTSLISDDIAKILDRHHDSLNDVMEFLAKRERLDNAYEWYYDNVVERRDFSPHDPMCLDSNKDLLAFALIDAVARGVYQLALNDAQIK